MNDNDCQVVIIGTYWGEFPDMFPAWLQSCERNSTIDFLIFTDNIYKSLPNNVKFIDMSFKVFKELARQKLEREICLNIPLKVCDYKPMYGKILEDYIKNYDYWGHCDFDMIFGDIRSYLIKYQISQYDKFLPLGHLSLYRNSEECFKYCQLKVDGKSHFNHAVESEENVCFDEIGIRQIYKEYHLKYFDKRIFADIAVHRKRFLINHNLDSTYQLFGWRDGKIFQVYWNEKSKSIECREFIYIHFQRRKMKLFLKDNDSNFWITQSGIYPWTDSEKINIELMQRYNKYPGKVTEWLEVQEKGIRIFLYCCFTKAIKIFHLNKKDFIYLLGTLNPYWGPKVDKNDKYNYKLIIEKNYIKRPYIGRTAKKIYEKSNCDLSFIVPVYNAVNSIKKCVESLLQQVGEYKIEIILVDDGSHDESLDIIRKYEEKYDYISVIHQENMGISGARNTGLEYAKGNYIALVDNDDYISPDYSKTLLDIAYRANADIVKCGHYQVKGRSVLKIVYPPIETENLGGSITDYSGYIWEGIVSRKIWEQIYFPEGYWYEDMITKILVYRYASKFVCIDKPLYYHTYHQNSASKKVWGKKSVQCLDQLYLPQILKEYSEKIGILEKTGLNKILLKEWGELLSIRTRNQKYCLRKAAFLYACDYLQQCHIDESTLDKKEKRIWRTMKNRKYINLLIINI